MADAKVTDPVPEFSWKGGFPYLLRWLKEMSADGRRRCGTVCLQGAFNAAAFIGGSLDVEDKTRGAMANGKRCD